MRPSLLGRAGRARHGGDHASVNVPCEREGRRGPGDGRVLQHVAAVRGTRAAWRRRPLTEARVPVRVGGFAKNAHTVDDVLVERAAERELAARAVLLLHGAVPGRSRVADRRPPVDEPEADAMVGMMYGEGIGRRFVAELEEPAVLHAVADVALPPGRREIDEELLFVQRHLRSRATEPDAPHAVEPASQVSQSR